MLRKRLRKTRLQVRGLLSQRYRNSLMTPDLRLCCVHHASTKSTTTTPVPTPEKDESPKRRPLLFSDLPLDIILDLGDILDFGSLCNLRLGSRGLRMALQTRFEKFCTDKLRAKPKLRIVSTWPLSLARATAITRYPAITQEILTVSIHVTIPVAAASISGLAKACEQNDAVLTSKFLKVCETLAGGNVGENCCDMLSTILRRLSRTTTVKVKAKDFPLPVLKTSNQLDDLYNTLANHVLQNRRTSSLATSESLERVLDSVAECRNNVENLSIEILPESLGGHFALDGTRGFNSAKLNMNNLTSLDLLLPTWDTDEAPLRQLHTGQTCTFIEGVIIATPNLNDLSLSGTQKHAISAAVISALCLVLKPDSLTMLDLQHIVATRDDLESLFLAQASTLRSLDLHGAALTTGSWHELALKLDGKLHLHDFHVGFLWNFRVGGYTCVTFSHRTSHPLASYHSCDECATWDVDSPRIQKVRQNMTEWLSTGVKITLPYNQAIPADNPYWQGRRGPFRAPSWSMRVEACEDFGLDQMANELRGKVEVYEECRDRALVRMKKFRV